MYDTDYEDDDMFYAYFPCRFCRNQTESVQLDRNEGLCRTCVDSENDD